MAFYLINKEAGCTSNDVIQILKRKLAAEKIGHAGTLDPFATGLLIVATDADTKFLDKFLEEKKVYSGEILFGQATDTYDITGKTTAKSDLIVDLDSLVALINEQFIGKIYQAPPIYSAKKVNGIPAYKYAFAEKPLFLAKIKRYIYSFEIKAKSQNLFTFKIEVSSGTYIRSVAHDLGQALQVPSLLHKLVRERIGTVSIKQSQLVSETLRSYTVKEILNINSKSLAYDEFKRLLEGKKINYSDPSQELIFKNLQHEIWAKQVERDLFKIYKRIR